MKLGLNGLGRIGKLSLWHHVARKHFSEIVVNVGRGVGTGLEHVAQVMEKDSTFGHLSQYLHGCHGGRVIEQLDEANGSMVVNGIPVRVLRQNRNPAEIRWRDHGVRLVADCTGAFLDPSLPAEHATGSLRGHLEAGAEKVLLSAPFKIKSSGVAMPKDAMTAIMGINHDDMDPENHNIISAASCTTTCLAFLVKPLLNHFTADKILSASMVTVHAATSSQTVLDSVPATNAKDLRKTRSVMNNIILTTTGAAKALSLVIPEMSKIGFMAESVRVPVSTGSLIILTVNLQADYLDAHGNSDMEGAINRQVINRLYQEAAQDPDMGGRLIYSEEQNVSSDMIGFPRAAAVVEALETHTRTAYSVFDLDRIPGLSQEARDILGPHAHLLQVPVTQAVIYGWYDNEL
ncbi:MAG: glyceraldehyde-3-phosphate dehydrogenase [Magnetococcales bacterium]|nr:glyceraldehyde-3-phosphate dehydrogenase [Magnetococcales bacterium]